MHRSYQTHSSNNTREDSTHEHHQMANTEIRLIIFYAAKDGEALYSQQKQDREPTVAQIMSSFTAKFRLKLNKVGKTTRPFRCDLNQIPYDYTHGQHQMVNTNIRLIIFFAAENREALYSEQQKKKTWS